MSNGKGSKPRPYSVSYTQYSENWNNIFRKKPKTNKTTPTDCHQIECELFIKDQTKLNETKNKSKKNEKTNN
jgi:hypothetical protein